MKKTKKGLFDWLAKKSEYIIQDAEELSRTHPATGKAKPFAILKLISLGYIIPMYTGIISNSPFFDRMIYVDLFAGSGINQIQHGTMTKPILGSPLVAINSAANPWDLMIFCEKDKEKEGLLDALEIRINHLSKSEGMSWAKSNSKFILGDINSTIDQVIREINKPRTHAFIFIDPFSLQLHWKTLKRLVINSRSDLFVNIMAHEIHRAGRSLEEAGKTDSDTLDKWYGGSGWNQLKTRIEITQAYSSNISRLNDSGKKPRTETVFIPIKAMEKVKKEPYYYLFFAARKTRRGNKWMGAVRSVRDELMKANDEDIKKVLDKLWKQQTELPDWSDQS